mmetsp:Transcript_12237/g.27081  ORF Transcript_12237/g.27081 Transcript_12237/m.27081 type:complete len:234 (-) Transcript_12237:120-821(-)
MGDNRQRGRGRGRPRRSYRDDLRTSRTICVTGVEGHDLTEVAELFGTYGTIVAGRGAGSVARAWLEYDDHRAAGAAISAMDSQTPWETQLEVIGARSHIVTSELEPPEGCDANAAKREDGNDGNAGRGGRKSGGGGGRKEIDPVRVASTVCITGAYVDAGSLESVAQYFGAFGAVVKGRSRPGTVWLEYDSEEAAAEAVRQYRSGQIDGMEVECVESKSLIHDSTLAVEPTLH